MTKQSIKSYTFQFLPILFISLLSIIIYSNTIHSPFVFDDIPNITEYPPIRMTDINLTSLKNAALGRASHRPIPNISFAVNYYMERYNVRGYHIVNIVIHTINGILVYLLALAVFTHLKGNSKENSLQINLMSLFASLIFVAHPINTQSVTYIVQRMNSMAVMFYLLSLFLYIKARLSNVKWRKWAFFSGVIISGILALGSKQIAATLPFIILLYEWYFFQDLKTSWLKKNIPYLIIPVIVLAALALIYMGENPVDRILAGYGSRDFTLIERVLTQFRIIIFYISLLILPLPSRLNLIHHINTSQSLLQPMTTLISLLIIVALIALSIYWVRKKRLISFSILWVFINLAIESSFIGLEMIFEHRLYLPMVGFSLMVSYIVFNYPSNKRILTAGLCVVIIMLLGYGAYIRNRTWKDGITLWSDVVAKNPLSYRGYNNLGLILREQGKVKEGIKRFHESLRIKPDSEYGHICLAEALISQGKIDEAIDHCMKALQINPDSSGAHNNLGLALDRQGKTDEAVKQYIKALTNKPDFAGAHNNLGLAFDRLDKIDKAVYHYREALRIDPEHVRSRINLGLSLIRQGKINEAIHCYREALRIDPERVEAHMNLGAILARQGKTQEAIKRYYSALRINPDSADVHYNLAGILNKQGKIDEAIKHYKRALDIRPDFPEVHNNLGLILAGQGRIEDAMNHYHAALRIMPDHVETHINLGVSLVSQGKIKEGASHFVQALRIRPEDPDAHFYLGSIYVIVGRKDLAIGEYRVLEKLRPDLAKTLLTRINQGIKKKTK